MWACCCQQEDAAKAAEVLDAEAMRADAQPFHFSSVKPPALMKAAVNDGIESIPSINSVTVRNSSGTSFNVRKSSSMSSAFYSVVTPMLQRLSALKRSQNLDFMSFASGENVLLRASSLTTILERGARIFSDSHGSDDTYALSRCVKSEGGIDYFISHNWCVGRWQKLLTLSCQFNFGLAAVVSYIPQIVFVLLAQAGYLPAVPVPWDPRPRGLLCKLLGTPIFLMVLILGGDVRKCFGLQGPSMFLDKTCICQSDKELQTQGIKKLGAFLAHSKTMVAIYSECYLRKLWTVYEFACFLASHPIDQIRLVPSSLPLVTVAVCTITSVHLICTTFLEIYTGFEFALEAVYIVVAPVLVRVFRMEARELRDMKELFADFSLSKCTCTCEEDRPLVYGNIADLMRQLRVVPPGTEDDLALAAFSSLARAKLPQLLEQAHRGDRYRYYVSFAAPITMPYWLDKQVGLAHGLDALQSLGDTVLCFTLIFALLPCTFASMAALSKHCLDLPPFLECCYTVLVCGSIVYPVCIFVSIALFWRSIATSKLSLVFCLLSLIVAYSTALFAFLGCPCRGRREDRKKVSRLVSLRSSDGDRAF